MTIWEQTRAVLAATMDAVFAEPVTYYATGGATMVINAIFTERFKSVDLSGDVPVDSTAPVFDILLADLAAEPKQGDIIERSNGDEYEVTKIEPDGEGGSKLWTVEA